MLPLPGTISILEEVHRSLGSTAALNAAEAAIVNFKYMRARSGDSRRSTSGGISDAGMDVGAGAAVEQSYYESDEWSLLGRSRRSSSSYQYYRLKHSQSRYVADSTREAEAVYAWVKSKEIPVTIKTLVRTKQAFLSFSGV